MEQFAKACFIIAFRMGLKSLFFKLIASYISTAREGWQKPLFKTYGCLLDPQPCLRECFQLGKLKAVFVSKPYRVAIASTIKLLLKTVGIP
jgi:hypothetical protein